MDPITDLAGAEAWLAGLINVERRRDVPYERLGLEPIRALLARAGDPHAGLAVLHIAGSKGKGSTALFAEALLRGLGERVGTFTSPHLERWTERFRIDGREVAAEGLVAAVEALRPHVEALREAEARLVPSWFDVTTAAAFSIFRSEAVERAVVEVGLGGRLDSTNVVLPEVACITSIELEHVNFLGDTLAKIAGEKAGIVKPERPVVMGALPPEAAAVVEARAQELDAPLSRHGREFEGEVLSAGIDGTAFRFRDEGFELEARIPALGAHQVANASVALAAVRRLPGVDVDALRRCAPEALAGAHLPGRVECLSRDPVVVVDSAHTAAASAALAGALATIPNEGVRLVVSISADKDLEAVLAPLLPGVRDVTVTRAEAARSLAASEVAELVRQLSPGTELHVVPNPHLAVRAARERTGAGELLCVTGSVYLAGIAREVLRAGQP